MKSRVLQISLVIIAGILLPNASSAQQKEKALYYPPNELRLGVSDGAPMQLFVTLGDVVSAITSDVFYSIAGMENTTITDTDESGTPNIGLAYLYHFNRWLSVGANLNYQRLKTEYSIKKADNLTEVAKANRTITAIMLLPEVHFTYLNKPVVQLYGQIGLGAVMYFVHKSSSAQPYDDHSALPVFAFQIDPIGVRVGKKYAGFFQLGFGFKGIATLGFSARF